MIGVVVLIPLNLQGRISETTADESKKVFGLDRLSIANIPNNDKEKGKLLWGHLIAAWLFTIGMLWLIQHAYKSYYEQRARFLSLRVPEAYSVLALDVPPEARTSEGLLAFFRKRYGDAVVSHSMAVDARELDKLVAERAVVARKLQHAVLEFAAHPEKGTPRMRFNSSCPSALSFCGGKVNAIEHFTARLTELNDSIAQLQAKEFAVTPCGFVSFNSLAVAVSAVQTLQTESPASWTVIKAPAPSDVYWPNLRLSGRRKSAVGVLISLAVFALVFFWAIPVSAIAVLANLQKLSRSVPALRPVVNFSPALTGFVQALIPTILLLVFMMLLPIILLKFARLEGRPSVNEQNGTVASRFFLFQMFNVLLTSVVAGAILPIISKLAESPFTVIALLGGSIPGVASFFINYVALQALSANALELLRIVPLVLGSIKYKKALTSFERRAAIAPGEFFYAAKMGSDLLVCIVGILYSTISPLVLPICLIYFAFGFLVTKHQLLYVYINSAEAGGVLFPLIVKRIMLGLVLMHITLIGLLAIKVSPLGVGVIPLPIIVILFARHVHRRFEVPTMFLPLGVAADIDAGRPALSESTGKVVCAPQANLTLAERQTDFAFVASCYKQPSLRAPAVPAEAMADEALVDELLAPHYADADQTEPAHGHADAESSPAAAAGAPARGMPAGAAAGNTLNASNPKKLESSGGAQKALSRSGASVPSAAGETKSSINSEAYSQTTLTTSDD